MSKPNNCDLCWKHKFVRVCTLVFGTDIHMLYICNKCLWFYTWTQNTRQPPYNKPIAAYRTRHTVPHSVHVVEDTTHSHECSYMLHVFHDPNLYFAMLPRDIIKYILSPMVKCGSTLVLEHVNTGIIHDIVIAPDCTGGRRQCLRGNLTLMQWRWCRCCSTRIFKR